MATPSFTSVPVSELPAKVRTSSISDEDKTTATTVATILATGQAARSSETYTEKRKATDAGVKLAGLVKRCATIDTGFPYHGKMSVRTIQINPTTFTYAIAPRVDEPSEAPVATETPTE